MRIPRTLAMSVLLALVACGGGHTSAASDAPGADVPLPTEPPDAAPDAAIDAAIDAMIDAAPPLPPCQYAEAADPTNDHTAEPSGVTVGAAVQRVCGRADRGHFDAGERVVDTDTFRITTAAAGDVLVRYSAPGAVGELSVSVLDTATNPTLLAGDVLRPDADHGAILATLPAGTYDLVITVRHTTDLAAPFDYRISISDEPPTRCPAVTAAASYTEANDGTGAGNDVIAVSFASDPSFARTAAIDAPEPTGLTIGAAPLRITGASADIDADDDYRDRDTYLVRTAATIDELTLRLDWAGDGVDLDYLVFPADQVAATGQSLLATPHQEYNVIPVKPDTAYWIWIGSHDGSTPLPAGYDLSICGATVIP